MGQLSHRRRILEGTDVKEKIALDESLKGAVDYGVGGIKREFSDSVRRIGESSKKHTDNATNTIVTELSKVSPPILEMIVESYNGLLERVGTLEAGFNENQAKSQSDLMKTLESAAKRLDKIDKRKFPVISLGGVTGDIRGVSTDLTLAVGMIEERLKKQDAAIKAIQTTVARKRAFDFDVIRDGDLLKKVVVTERT